MNRHVPNFPRPSDKRQGGLHAGIRYQYLKTILAWITLKDRDGYVVSEWIDDVFAADRGTAVISDTKYINSANSLTLRSPTVLDCLSNAFVHLVENEPTAEVRYAVTTNLPAGNESPVLAGLGTTGLLAWTAARSGDTSKQDSIIRFLIDDSAIAAKVKTYLRANSSQQVWADFLGKVWFDLESGDLLQTYHAVDAILKERCEQYSLPRVGVSSFIEHLESIVSDAATRSTPKATEPRTLTLPDFEAEWDKHFMEKNVSYTQWCKETFGTGRLLVLDDADDWLETKFGVGFSRREMIENRIAYFSGQELDYQAKAIAELVGSDLGGDAAISGNVGSGKTLLAASIAVQLSNQAYQIYYASISAESRPGDLIADIQFAQERSKVPIVVVLDDCHRNFDVLVRLRLRRKRIKLPAILFVANDQDLYLRAHEEIEYNDVLDMFGQDKVHLSTNLTNPDFDEKISGIINSWGRAHPDRHLQTPKRSEITRIASEAHGNLGSLKAALAGWHGNASLRQLVEEKARGVVYHCFLSEHRTTESERNLLLQTAAVASYDVDFSVPNSLRDTAATLRKRGLLEKTSRDRFCFMDSARPNQLIDTYLHQRKDSERVFATLLVKYIESHETLPANAGQLLLAIGSERSNDVIETLFGQRETLDRIEKFLASAPSNRIAIEFLFRVRDVVDRPTLRRLFSAQLVDLPERFSALAEQGDALILWTKCLRLSSYCDQRIVHRLHQAVDSDLVESFVRSSGFHQLAYCVWTLSDINREEAKFILENAHSSPLMDSATELPPYDFVRAIRRLREVDVKWTQRFCNEAAGDRDGPFSGLLCLAVDDFASAIGELNWCDELSVKKFLHAVEDEDLEQFAARSSAASIAIAASTLKDVDRLFAKRFLDATTKTENSSPFSRQAISNLGNSLSELYRVSDCRARAELRRYSDDDLLAWARAAPLFKLGKTFAELGKIDAQRVKRLFEQIGYRNLAEKARGCENVGHLTKALSELSGIDNERARFILDSVDDGTLIEMFHVCSVDSLGRSLREVQNVDKKQAEWIAKKMDPADIADSYREVSLRNLGHYLSEIRTVSPRLSSAILDRLDSDALVDMVNSEPSLGELFAAIAKIHGVEGRSKRKLGKTTMTLLREAENRFPVIASQKRCRFEEISNGLRAANRIDSSVAKRLFRSLSFSRLEAKLRSEQVEKVLVALGSLSKIDRDISFDLLERIIDDRFIAKAKSLAPDRLASAVNSIAQVSRDHANKIVEAIVPESFRKSFVAMDIGRQTQVGRKLDAFSPAQAERLLGSYAPADPKAKAKPRRKRNLRRK